MTQNTIPAPVYFHLPPRSAVTDVQLLKRLPPSMAAIAATNITGPQNIIWQTVNRRKQTVTVRWGTAQERTAAAMYPILAIKPSDNERRILFPRAVGAAPENHIVAADIALEINKSICTTRVPAHIRIQRLVYNKKGNPSGLTKPVAMSNMMLSLHRELLLRVATK